MRRTHGPETDWAQETKTVEETGRTHRKGYWVRVRVVYSIINTVSPPSFSLILILVMKLARLQTQIN